MLCDAAQLGDELPVIDPIVSQWCLGQCVGKMCRSQLKAKYIIHIFKVRISWFWKVTVKLPLVANERISSYEIISMYKYIMCVLLDKCTVSMWSLEIGKQQRRVIEESCELPVPASQSV